MRPLPLLLLSLTTATSAGGQRRADPPSFPIRNGVTHLEQPTVIMPVAFVTGWPHLLDIVQSLQSVDTAAGRAGLEALLAQHPNDDGALNLLAQLERVAGKLDAALQLTDRALRVAPDNDLHHFQRALTCYEKRERASGIARMTWHGRTLDAYETALRLEPRGMYYRYYVAYTRLNAPRIAGGDKQRALALANEGVGLGQRAFIVVRADVLLRLGRVTEAFADYDAAVEARFFKTASFVGAIRAAVGAGQMDRADRYERYAMAHVPTDPRVLEARRSR